MNKRNNEKNTPQTTGTVLLIGFSFILIRACVEFYKVAWGTGNWLGEFSLKWGVGFFAFIANCIAFETIFALSIWKKNVLVGWRSGSILLRKKLGVFRWLIILVLLLFPVWFLQYTPWGIVFSGLYFRLFLWIYVVLGIAFFLQTDERLYSFSGMLSALLITTSTFSIAASLMYVTEYPFSLGWSEGNRLWDYSMLFGKHLYDYPQEQDVYVLIDYGRQFIGGFPFLFSDVSIQAERLWVGLTTLLPYLFLGFAAFRFSAKDKKRWFLFALLAFIFLKQGPIHPPLVMCAFVVALLWRSPLWIAIPLIFITGYAAEESRFTWLFAPAIWIVILEFSGATLENGRIKPLTWWRAVILGLSGAAGGYYGSTILSWVKALFSSGDMSSVATGGAISVSTVTGSASVQPLLWYRLFPNSTYGIGVLFALVLAIFPIVTLLFYLVISKRWVLNTWQKIGILLPLLAFLSVGLIVSAKIGGGGDLHNLDMFLIGLFFTLVIAWENGGRQWLREIEVSPVWVRGMLALLMIIPGIYPLSVLRSFHFSEQLPWLTILTDVSDGKFLDQLPPQDEVDDILRSIRHEVEVRETQGEVLFIDQRQLLTFGFIKVPFVPEYEKKILMNESMSNDNISYFSRFYIDLEAHRFSLIVTEPLRAPSREDGFQFGEESDAWVKWVVRPILCYYDEVSTWKDVQIQLLVPKQGNFDCSNELPIDIKK